MSELHWTGAALLLSIAVLIDGSPRPPRLGAGSAPGRAADTSDQPIPRRAGLRGGTDERHPQSPPPTVAGAGGRYGQPADRAPIGVSGVRS